MDIQHHVRPMLDQAAAALHLLAAADDAAEAASTIELSDELAMLSPTAALAAALQARLTDGPHVRTACWLLGGLDAVALARSTTHAVVVELREVSFNAIPHGTQKNFNEEVLCVAEGWV